MIRYTGIALVTFAALGCGAVPNMGLPDAKDRDSGPDADASGTANVVTNTHTLGFGKVGAAQPNVPVISNLANGDVFDMQMTDSTGKATIKVYPGGSVTAIYAHLAPDTATDFGTFFGVVIVAMITQALVIFRIDPYFVQIVLGLLILWAVGVNRLREVRFRLVGRGA